MLVYKDENALLTIDISQEPLSPVVLSEKAHKPVAGATQFDVDAQGRIYALVRRDKTEDCPDDEPWCLPFIDELTRFNSDGSGAEVVSGAQIVEEQFEHSVHHFSVSPDGKTLAFGTGTIKCPPLVTQVYLLDLEQPGAQASQLTAFDVQPKFAGGSSNCGAGARHITWSPDGKRLVFAGNWRASEAEEKEREALFSVSVDGGDVTRFLYPSEGEVAPHTIKTPWRFAPDAQSLFAIGDIDGNERLIGTSDFESTDQLVKDRVLFEMGCPFVMKP